jgi:transcriptional regulator with XRE-family HTH domain
MFPGDLVFVAKRGPGRTAGFSALREERSFRSQRGASVSLREDRSGKGATVGGRWHGAIRAIVKKKAKVRNTGTEKNRTRVETHPRKIVVTKADMVNSARLERLAKRLTKLHKASGMTKPQYAEFLGVSGSQFRYLRRGRVNPSIHALASLAKRTRIPLYELLEDASLGARKSLSGPQMSENLGKMIARCQKASGLTKEEFADWIDVAFSQFFKIVKGRCNPSLLVSEHIAKRLGMTLWQLLGVEKSEPRWK